MSNKENKDKNKIDETEKVVDSELNEEISNEKEADDSQEKTTEKKKVKKLSDKEKLAESHLEILKLKDKLARNLAEFENFRRRNIQERERWIKMATERIVLEVCEVLDNFERAIESGVKEHQFDDFKKGMDMIFSQLGNVLKKEDVCKIDCLGKDFNPEFHEALSHMPSADFEENKIAAVVQNGYMMNDKVIRPARVLVSSGAPKEEKEEV